MSSVLAINDLEMTLNENEIFTVDFTSFIHIREKIIGVVSVTLAPINGPVISEIGYTALGKHVSFRLDATQNGVIKTTFTLSVVVTTLLDGSQMQKEAKGTLKVC